MARNLLPFALLAPTASSLSCLSESGAPVPWFAIFKLHGGLDYAYVDAAFKGAPGPLVLTGRSLDCGKSCALGATLSSLINNADAARVTWNDELPVAAAGAGAALNVSSATSGHSKGVLAADASGGFWLTHSMPKFPLLVGVDAFSWAAGGASTTYGQTFLCVSVAPAEVENVAAGVQYIDPHIYGSVVPAGLQGAYPALTALVAGARTAGATSKTVSSTAGNVFTYFAKSGSWGKDIWEDLVQDALSLDMWVETWLRAPVMPTYCRPTYAHDSVNVETMRFVTAAGTDVPFKYTQDHSKLGIAVNGTSQENYVCIGDNNRMTSQWTRGGGAVCFRHAPTYRAVLAMVSTVQPCP